MVVGDGQLSEGEVEGKMGLMISSFKAPPLLHIFHIEKDLLVTNVVFQRSNLEYFRISLTH